MLIYYNDHHARHDVVGRFVKRPGEAHLQFWDASVHQPAPELYDDAETPLRMKVILSALEAAGMRVKPPQDFGTSPLAAVHSPDYLHHLEHIYAENAAQVGAACPVLPEAFAVRTSRRPTGLLGRKGYYASDVYSPILEGTWEAAYWSAQTALTTAQSVLDGQRVAYALCRPSGHHAGRDVYGGYCYLNNAAVAARHLRTETGARVALLDFDYHHGNGTQDIFYNDPNVFFVSLHGDPEHAFPYYSGWADERGVDAGEGFTLNIPLQNGTGDVAYLASFDSALDAIRAYAPAYLVVSAGFDIGANDPYGGFLVTRECMGAIGARIRSLALPTVLIQEGGYLPSRLGEYVATFLKAFGAE
jgi:acetoin utilization deacetylase AcuC-like enzyme